MQMDDAEVVLLDLKYCERCGGLWLRRRGSAEVHCSVCSQDTGLLGRWEIRPARSLRPARAAVAIPKKGGTAIAVMCSRGGRA